MPRRTYNDLGYEVKRLRIVLSEGDWAALRLQAGSQGADLAATVGLVLHLWASDWRAAVDASWDPGQSEAAALAFRRMER